MCPAVFWYRVSLLKPLNSQAIHFRSVCQQYQGPSMSVTLVNVRLDRKQAKLLLDQCIIITVANNPATWLRPAQNTQLTAMLSVNDCHVRIKENNRMKQLNECETNHAIGRIHL